MTHIIEHFCFNLGPAGPARWGRNTEYLKTVHKHGPSLSGKAMRRLVLLERRSYFTELWVITLRPKKPEQQQKVHTV